MKKLQKYEEKRDFNKTKEPKGAIKKSKKKLHFVIQHHLARKDHYDVRLEWNGTLKSWAVPKGPSYNPKDKRLAIQVEDHPLDYRHFEGTIPKGQYGGGTVMIFDEGYWEPTEFQDFSHSFKFVLKGKRIEGKWTFIHLEKENWLLIKEKDFYSNKTKISQFKTSIKTGRTMKEIESHIKKCKNSDKNHIIEGIEISNPNKIIFSKPKVTKYDIAKYYQKVSSRMIPYIENRIISTVRAPEGVENEKFFKKHFENLHQNMGKVRISSSKEKKEDYYYIKNAESLLSEVQMNSYEFHIWGSTYPKINKPNYLVFDLDPDEKMPLKKVREGVKDLKSILDELHLVSFLKTSGGKGYHIIVPIQSLSSWTSFRAFAKNIAKIMEMKWPEKYVSNMSFKKRKGHIYIDWVRNTKMATSVAPYSLRVKSKPTVSMPISWNELDKIKPDDITMDLAIKRLKRKDPWEGFFEVDQ